MSNATPSDSETLQTHVEDAKKNASKPFLFPVMKKAIEDLFSGNTLSKSDIEAFQDRYWEQLVPNFSQALKLLDIHGVPRHNILWSINDRLLEAIKTNIEARSSDGDVKKSQKLWQKLIKTGMVYIHHPYMRSVIMQVLGKMNSIKERHVNMIVDNEYLYVDAPLPVLRHIWVSHPHKFHQELDQVITRFQTNWSDALLDALAMAITASSSSTAELLPLLYWPPRRRRRDPAIVRIVEMIGDGETLYNKTIHILREQCSQAEETSLPAPTVPETASPSSPPKLQPPPPKRRRHKAPYISGEDGGEKLESPTSTSSAASSAGASAHVVSTMFLSSQAAVASATLCTLRFDLLMSLNDAKVDRLCVRDRIHRLVWCLDACVRNRRIDQRHASGLAYHLQLQRQRYARETDDTECEKDEGDPVCTTGKHSRAGHKGTLKRTNSDSSGQGNKVLTKNLLECDVHMACRDPWVVYTLCTSLIRYALNGLYEDKLPRDIPELSLLASLLLQGIGNEIASTTSPEEHSVSSGDDGDGGDHECSAKVALVGHILPAVAHLQTLAWRAHVAEEVLTIAGHLWPNPAGSAAGQSVASSAGATPFPAATGGGGQRRISTSDPKDTRTEHMGHLPHVWRKSVTEANQSTGITLPAGYLSHPLGLLILQYHALFALERSELAVLRCLLKTAANIVQHQHSRSGHKQPNRSTTKPPPTSPPAFLASTLHGFSSSCLFRWRPDVLQALVLGIARLPVTSPAFVDSGRRSGSLNTTSALGDNGGDGLSDKSPLDCSPAIPGSVIGGSSDAKCKADSITAVSDQHHRTFAGGSACIALVSRAELAILLRGSLTLVNDMQLLALAQIVLLVPGSNPGSSSAVTTASIAASTIVDSHSQIEVTSPTSQGGSTVLSERERLINVLARHCTTSVATLTTPAVDTATDTPSLLTTPSPATVYKSSNPRVLQVLEFLRKDVDRTGGCVSTSLPLTLTTNLSAAKALGLSGLQSAYCTTPVPLASGSGFRLPPSCQSESWPGGGVTPRSPTSMAKYSSRSLVAGSHEHLISPSAYSSSNAPRLNCRGTQPTASSSCFSHTTAMSPYASHLPIGTPLTNPGLMGATPNLSNFSVGQGSSLPTPRGVPSPPSSIGDYIAGLTSSYSSNPSSSSVSMPSQLSAFHPDVSASSCPSPSVHGSGGGATDSCPAAYASLLSHHPPSPP